MVIDNRQNLHDSKNAKPSSYYNVDFVYTSVWMQIKMPNVDTLYISLQFRCYYFILGKNAMGQFLYPELELTRDLTEEWKKERKGHKFNVMEGFCQLLLRKGNGEKNGGVIVSIRPTIIFGPIIMQEGRRETFSF